MSGNEEQHMFRTMVADFVASEITANTQRWEDSGGFDGHDLFSKMGALNLLGLEYEETYGGSDASAMYTAILFEELGRSLAMGVAMAIGVQTDMSTPALATFGTHELKKQFLAPALGGTAVAAVGITEPDAGSDVAGLRATAVRDGDNWIINGTKLYITNALQADWICVLVVTDPNAGYSGFSQIVVPTSATGFSVSKKLDKLGMRSSDTGEIVYTDVSVPVSNTIGEIGRGFQQQMQQFQNERLVASYQIVGACEEALARTKDYLGERNAFGNPLLNNQHISYELADLYSELAMLKEFNYAAAKSIDRGENVTNYATVAKLRSARLIRRVADSCLQFHGGVGYMEETWTARFFRDARLWSIGGGADEVMLRTIARLEGFA